ncbi:hypothetical protein ACLOJK_016821 [Asimina triloba]
MQLLPVGDGRLRKPVPGFPSLFSRRLDSPTAVIGLDLRACANMAKSVHIVVVFVPLLLFCAAAFTAASQPPSPPSPRICIVGSGIGGSSMAHFLKSYSAARQAITDIRIFEKRGRVGGRMATVSIAGDTFEAGASIIHPKNFHALNFTQYLHLRTVSDGGDDASSWFGIWDGARFVFKTLPPPATSMPSFYKKIISLLNSFLVFRRYGLSLLRMQRFVNVCVALLRLSGVKAVDDFSLYYKGFESRPVFSTVEGMLKWPGLYGLTQSTLQEELAGAGLSQQLISELVTVITRINYGQNVTMSGLAGAVSLAGSDAGLWAVEGGNWQIADGLIRRTNASLHLHEEIASISSVDGYYLLNSAKGNSYSCDVAVIATPLDEVNISFSPPISVPKRKMQHTHATFVRGLLNPAFFGVKSASDIPSLVGTIESPDLQFSSISVLKQYSEDDKTYKVFSRKVMADELLDLIFSVRKETLRINWPAYPHYEAPEVFAPILLDGLHLYYINAFENAASTIETSAVAAENVARLIVSRLSSGLSSDLPTLVKSVSNSEESMHSSVQEDGKSAIKNIADFEWVLMWVKKARFSGRPRKALVAASARRLPPACQAHALPDAVFELCCSQRARFSLNSIST